MLCTKCNAENPAEARFCGRCGMALSGGPPVIPASPKIPPNDSASPKSRWSVPVMIAGGAVVLIVVAGLIGLFFLGFSQSSKPVLGTTPDLQQDSVASRDAYYRQKLVGNWRARKAINGAFIDVNCLYMEDGRASWSGSLTYMGQQTFLMYSGMWQIENGMLRTRIESSNVPQLIPVGTTGGSKFVSITDEEWIYVDLSDGQTGTAFRTAGLRN